MHRTTASTILALTLALFVICVIAISTSAQSLLAQVPPPSPQVGDDDQPAPGTEVLTRGPVHEAFATPMELDPKPGPIIKTRPPAPIQEIPPDQKPDGVNIVWIGGYWAFDDEKDDFMWISGLYRNAPPGQAWMPGYWNEVEGGYQWNQGFWASTNNQEVQYLPEEPPQTLENGPTSPAPSEDHFWVPGNWVYQNVTVQQPY